MKKPFKSTILGKIIIGAADGFTGGAVSNIVYQTEESPAGSADYAKLLGAAIPIVLLWMFASGKLTYEQLNDLINLFQGQ